MSFISGDITAIISRPTLTGNYAAGGGAVYSSSGSDRTLSDMTTSGNHSTGAGGGIYTAYAESLVIENSTISGTASAPAN